MLYLRIVFGATTTLVHAWRIILRGRPHRTDRVPSVHLAFRAHLMRREVLCR